MQELYLDWNATTPLHPRALAAMQEAAQQTWGNPASLHAAGRRARAKIEDVREGVAALLGLSTRDVIFTSGATEANNLALQGATALVTSRLEHPSITKVAEALEQAGRRVLWLTPSPAGVVGPEAVGEALTALGADAPRATVALMAVNHETGVVQPIAEVSERVQAAGARLHVDAVQLVGKRPLDALRGADSVSLSGHKVQGPKGVGVLGWRGAWTPRPVLRGGSQERGFRPGTQDAVAVAGLGVALELAQGTCERWARVAPLRDELERALVGTGRALVNGADAERLPHVSNVSFTGWRGDELVAAADLAGLQLSSGSACSAGSTEPSAVVSAMVGRERALGSVRFSLPPTLESAQLKCVIHVMFQLLGR